MSQLIFAEDCVKILKKYRSEIKKQLISFDIGRLSENISGFLGDHLRLTLHYQEDENDNSVHVSFFVKCIPQTNPNASVYVTEMGVFQKEILLYRDLLPEMQKLVTIKFCPENYLCDLEKCFLVLENLADEGYGTSKGSTFNDDEIEALLCTLAAFHASCIIYEEKRSVDGTTFRLYDKFQEALKEGTFSASEGHVRFKWGRNASKAVADCAALHPLFANNEELKNKVAEFLKKHVDEYIKPSKVFRNVITHDDLWRNNIMFRKNNHTGLDCVFVDFQLTRYTPPALDLLTALFLNVDSTKLRNSMSILFDKYYENLSVQLENNEIDPNIVLPKQEFLRSIEAYRLPALFETVMYGTNVFIGQKLSNVIMSDKDVFKNFNFYDRSKYVCQEFQENNTFRERFSDVLVPFLQSLTTETK